MSDRVTVAVLPDCDFCKFGRLGAGRPVDRPKITPAAYDGKTNQAGLGVWAFMCEEHFETYGVGLGTGLGQRLVLAGSEPST